MSILSSTLDVVVYVVVVVVGASIAGSPPHPMVSKLAELTVLEELTVSMVNLSSIDRSVLLCQMIKQDVSRKLKVSPSMVSVFVSGESS